MLMAKYIKKNPYDINQEFNAHLLIFINNLCCIADFGPWLTTGFPAINPRCQKGSSDMQLQVLHCRICCQGSVVFSVSPTYAFRQTSPFLYFNVSCVEICHSAGLPNLSLVD